MVMSHTSEGTNASSLPAGSTGSAANGNEPERPRRWVDQLKYWTQRFKHPSSLRSDLQDVLESETNEQDADDLSAEERTMLKNILELRETRVDDVMTPRADIVAIPVDITLGQLLLLFQDAEHSRLPVYGESLDDPSGFIHIKDVMGFLAREAKGATSLPPVTDAKPAFDLTRVDLSQTLENAPFIRRLMYVPPSMRAMELLARMQATHQHMALVIDEYGGTDGLVTIEDLIEIVVGDIADEHDEDEGPSIIQTQEGDFIADASETLEDAFKTINIAFNEEELDEDIDTLGGLVTMIAGRVPVAGESFEWDAQGGERIRFEVLEADPRRLKRIRISVLGTQLDTDTIAGTSEGIG